MNFNDLLVLWNSNHKNRKNQITMSYLSDYIIAKAKLILGISDDELIVPKSKKVIKNLNILVEEKQYNNADFIFCISVIDFKSEKIITSSQLFEIKVSNKKTAATVITEQIFLRRKEILKHIQDYGNDVIIKTAEETIAELDKIISDVFFYTKEENHKIKDNLSFNTTNLTFTQPDCSKKNTPENEHNVVDINQWIDNAYFIGTNLNKHCYPKIKSTVVSIISNNKHKVYLTGNIGCGKSVCQKILIMRKLYELSIMNNIQKELGFYEEATIDIVFMLPRANMRMLEFHRRQFLSLIYDTQYFTDHFPVQFVNNCKIVFPNNVVVSFENNLANKNVIYAFSDNDPLFVETTSKCEQRILTRFPHNTNYGFICVIPNINIENSEQLSNSDVFCLS